MNQLNLLWQLQNCDKKLLELNESLDKFKKGEEIDELHLKLKQIEYDSTNINTQIEVNNAKIDRNNRKLENLRIKLEEIDEKLYSGDVSDLGQLEFMNNENKKIEEENSKLESDTLELMENIEELKKASIEVSKAEEETNKQLKIAESEQKEHIEKAENDIENLKEDRKQILEKLDEDIISKYTDLKKSKGKDKAIVEVSKQRCTGCHMSIPLSILSKLKKNSVLTYCDNCGRILYYEKE